MRRVWAAAGAGILGLTLLLMCTSIVESSTLQQSTDTPTPTATSTPTAMPTPTAFYTSTPEPVVGGSPPGYENYSVIPQGSVEEGTAPDLTCPSFPTFTLTPWSWTPISFPDLSFDPISPTIPDVYTFTMQPFTMTIPDWDPITVPVPTLPVTSTGWDIESSTVTVTLPFSLVFNFTTITNVWHPVITRAYQLQEDVEDDVLGGDFGVQGAEGGLSIQNVQADALQSMEIAGYTASEMASEMTYGMGTAFDYLRAVADIGILGPTVTAILVGLGWISIVTFGKFLFKSIIVIIDVTVAVLRIVIDVIIAILNALDLIPFI